MPEPGTVPTDTDILVRLIKCIEGVKDWSEWPELDDIGCLELVQAEIERLRLTVTAREAHITDLQGQVAAWQKLTMEKQAHIDTLCKVLAKVMG